MRAYRERMGGVLAIYVKTTTRGSGSGSGGLLLNLFI